MGSLPSSTSSRLMLMNPSSDILSSSWRLPPPVKAGLPAGKTGSICAPVRTSNARAACAGRNRILRASIGAARMTRPSRIAKPATYRGWYATYQASSFGIDPWLCKDDRVEPSRRASGDAVEVDGLEVVFSTAISSFEVPSFSEEADKVVSKLACNRWPNDILFGVLIGPSLLMSDDNSIAREIEKATYVLHHPSEVDAP